MDETDSPQTPAELLVILAAIADEKIPIQTIAPKFTGRFNKGVDYVGDLAQFERGISQRHLGHRLGGRQIRSAAQSEAQRAFRQRQIFYLSPPFAKRCARLNAGVHVKTAGTTWLEELIGLAEAGGDGLALAKEIYAQAYEQREALCAPYAAVIDIDPATSTRRPAR